MGIWNEKLDNRKVQLVKLEKCWTELEKLELERLENNFQRTPAKYARSIPEHSIIYLKHCSPVLTLLSVKISLSRQKSVSVGLVPVFTLGGLKRYPRSKLKAVPIFSVPLRILVKPLFCPLAKASWTPREVPSPPLGVQDMFGPGVTATRPPAGSVMLDISRQ